MNENEKAKTVELVRRIQFGKGSNEDLKTLERATGNPNLWIIFEALELEGFAPEKLFKLLGGNEEIQASKFTISASVQT
jgi:hypothetical protein